MSGLSDMGIRAKREPLSLPTQNSHYLDQSRVSRQSQNRSASPVCTRSKISVVLKSARPLLSVKCVSVCTRRRPSGSGDKVKTTCEESVHRSTLSLIPDTTPKSAPDKAPTPLNTPQSQAAGLHAPYGCTARPAISTLASPCAFGFTLRQSPFIAEESAKAVPHANPRQTATPARRRNIASPPARTRKHLTPPPAASPSPTHPPHPADRPSNPASPVHPATGSP